MIISIPLNIIIHFGRLVHVWSKINKRCKNGLHLKDVKQYWDAQENISLFLSEKNYVYSRYQNFLISENGPASVLILLLQIDNKHQMSYV